MQIKNPKHKRFSLPLFKKALRKATASAERKEKVCGSIYVQKIASKRSSRPDAQKTALIVDDSCAQRAVFSKHLQRWGYETQEARSGIEALEACARSHFNLILSDWMMPEMDGLEFCRAFRRRAQEKYSYFILLTSKNDKHAVAEGLDVGADDFLSKPVSPLELRARIAAGERLLAMEQEVRTARAQLLAAVEALDDGFAYFDAEDRLVLANRKFRELAQLDPAALMKGVRFEDLLRQGLKLGRYADAIGREEDWLRLRMETYRNTGRSTQRLSDGRVLQIVERRTEDGGRVGLRVDVTELSLARENARKSEAQALHQNRELRAALDELQKLYDAIDRDLMEARKLQHSLIRKRQHEFDGSTLSLLLQSSGHVGGDMVGTFLISATRIGIYAIDVSGHGVAAAMLGARIAGLFSAGEHHQNIVVIRDPETGISRACDPHDVAMRINELMLEEFETETYLTIAYADIDLATGKIRLVQAGHPHPVIQRADGTIEYIGGGGLPIGLIPNARFATIEARLLPGDRLLLYSDGVTECTNRISEEFGENGLRATLMKLAHVKGTDFVEALKWELMHWSGKDEFDDDVSGALLEFHHTTSLANQPLRY